MCKKAAGQDFLDHTSVRPLTVKSDRPPASLCKRATSSLALSCAHVERETPGVAVGMPDMSPELHVAGILVLHAASMCMTRSLHSSSRHVSTTSTTSRDTAGVWSRSGVNFTELLCGTSWQRVPACACSLEHRLAYPIQQLPQSSPGARAVVSQQAAC